MYLIPEIIIKSFFSKADSEVPEITVPEKIYNGIEAVVTCVGLIGKGNSGEIDGLLVLETNFGVCIFHQSFNYHLA